MKINFIYKGLSLSELQDLINSRDKLCEIEHQIAFYTTFGIIQGTITTNYEDTYPSHFPYLFHIVKQKNDYGNVNDYITLINVTIIPYNDQSNSKPISQMILFLDNIIGYSLVIK